MAKVKPISLLYIDGIRGVTQKHKSGERRHRKKDGTFVEPLGFGNAKEDTPSEYWLSYETGEGRGRVRIDRYFKERRKKLTPGRRQKLEAAMPDEVQLTECTVYGQKVVTVSEADMDQWCADAGIK